MDPLELEPPTEALMHQAVQVATSIAPGVFAPGEAPA
jgi:hypothetical protein